MPACQRLSRAPRSLKRTRQDDAENGVSAATHRAAGEGNGREGG